MSAPVWDLVHIITKLELGGAQRATLHEVEHATWPMGRRFLLHGPGGMLDGRAGSATVVEIPDLERPIEPRRDTAALWQIVRALRRIRRPGRRLLVHTHSSKAGILGRWAAFIAGADRVVHSIHGFGHTPAQAPMLRSALLAAEQATAHVTDGYTADSEANLRQARGEAILGETPARVVRCAIDISEFETPRRSRELVRAELGIPMDADVVINVACLKPQKDPESYVEVAARVNAARPATVFLLAGDGELRARVNGRAHAAGLGERFRLLGWRDDVAELLHASDLLVLTSLWEGLPQTFPQAMAARRPIVATRVDGAPEAITDNGLLYEVGEVDAMAAGVVELLADPQRRAHMGERGFARVGAFSAERMIRDLDMLYAEVAALPRNRLSVLRAWRQVSHWLRLGNNDR